MNSEEVVSLEHSIFSFINLGDESKCIKLLKDDNSLLFATEDHYGLTILHLGAQKRWIDFVKLILELSRNFEDFDVDKLDLNGNTALHYSCSDSISEINNSTAEQLQQQLQQQDQQPYRNNSDNNNNKEQREMNQLEIVEQLLDRGADVNLKNKMNYQPIHLACRSASYLLVEKLLEFGGDCRAPHERILDVDMMSLQLKSLLPLTDYEQKRTDERKQKIIAKLGGTRGLVKNGPTCLHYVLANVNALIDQLAEIHRRSSADLETYSHRDIEYLSLIELLLSKGVNANAIDIISGRTALSEFICRFPSNEEQLSRLLSINDSDIDNQQQRNMILAKPVSIVFKRILKLLVKDNSFDLALCDDNNLGDTQPGETALIHCASNPSKLVLLQSMLEFITENNMATTTDILESKNAKGQTALFAACAIGNLEAANLLLTARANADAVDNFGNTPIHEALSFGYFDIAHCLVEHGADVNRPMAVYPQSTPLHIAVQLADLDMVDFFLKHGALLDSVDGEKRTPLDVADNQEIIDFLMGHVQVTVIHQSKFVVSKHDFQNEMVGHINDIYGLPRQPDQRNYKVIETNGNKVTILVEDSLIQKDNFKTNINN